MSASPSDTTPSYGPEELEDAKRLLMQAACMIRNEDLRRAAIAAFALEELHTILAGTGIVLPMPKITGRRPRSSNGAAVLAGR